MTKDEFLKHYDYLLGDKVFLYKDILVLTLEDDVISRSLNDLLEVNIVGSKINMTFKMTYTVQY